MQNHNNHPGPSFQHYVWSACELIATLNPIIECSFFPLYGEGATGSPFSFKTLLRSNCPKREDRPGWLPSETNPWPSALPLCYVHYLQDFYLFLYIFIIFIFIFIFL